MKVFISWSGSLSQELGNKFREWIPYVLQGVKPYFTPSDIEKGARWSTDIAQELENSQMGVFCMTRDNLHSDWILFEAGAISKQFAKGRICTILFGISTSDLPAPLSQFQATPFNEAEIRKLMQTINESLKPNGLSELAFDNTFQKWWPELERDVQGILTQHKQTTKEPSKSTPEMLEEILELSRLISRQSAAAPTAISQAAIKSILETYLETHNSVKVRSGSEEVMKQLATMKNAVLYFAKFVKQPHDFDLIVNTIQHLPFKCDEEYGDIPF